MIPEAKLKQELYTQKQNFIEALEIAYLKLSVSDGVVKELRRIIAKVKKSALEQRIDIQYVKFMVIFVICSIIST
jgi:predicted transcriptional regulator